MNDTSKQREFYTKLKEKLSLDTSWPADYLFKFIVGTDKNKITEIENAFNNLGAVIETKESSKGNFTSVSILVKMENPDSVIKKYIDVSHIEGIISL